MRRDHDALILQVRNNPDILTQLRRKREAVEQEGEALSVKLDADYRVKVISGQIDDAETLADIETEISLDREIPNWKIIGDFLEELKRARTPRLSITVSAANNVHGGMGCARQRCVEFISLKLLFENIPVIGKKIGDPDRGVGGAPISDDSCCLTVQLQITKVALSIRIRATSCASRCATFDVPRRWTCWRSASARWSIL